MKKNKKTKFNNFEDEDAVGYLLREIETLLDKKFFYSAFLLSLTIPDMLGKLAYPKIDKVGERYVKWFDANVKNIFGFLYSDVFYKDTDCPRMSGEVCYRLRCKLLHEGVNNIKDKTDINEFVLSVSDEAFVRGNYAGRDYLFEQWNPEANESPCINYLYVSCKELCTNIINAAKAFVKSNPNLDYPKIRINNGGGRISDIWFIK